ncbi:GNAT family N-acetyltransferase [Streptosporangium sp. KLBMP 9127]|nr:GNAT family N-acetyltransferase [Streptosporangium sp. KLBMP 9127]
MNAGEAASLAAASRGVRVCELREIEDFEQVSRLFDEIWHPTPTNPPITVELMRALAHSGNYVAGAYRNDQLVGGSVGFLAEPVGRGMHSHVTGVTLGGTGFALKLHQRAWALARGLDRITWTYDPLVRRNAYFNLAKLGAAPVEYLQRFYGAMDDEVNAGDESDRILAAWELGAPHVVAAAGGEPYRPEVPPDAVIALEDRAGRPVPGRADAAVVLVAVPEDVEALRRGAPEVAAEWRHAVREVLGGLLADGARVTGFHRRTYYVLERKA